MPKSKSTILHIQTKSYARIFNVHIYLCSNMKYAVIKYVEATNCTREPFCDVFALNGVRFSV